MDEKEQRSFIRFLAKELKEYARELMAYQLAFRILEQGPLKDGAGNELLAASRKHPALQAKFDKHFEGFDALLPPPDPDFEDLVKELLAKWKPSGGLPN